VHNKQDLQLSVELFIERVFDDVRNLIYSGLAPCETVKLLFKRCFHSNLYEHSQLETVNTATLSAADPTPQKHVKSEQNLNTDARTCEDVITGLGWVFCQLLTAFKNYIKFHEDWLWFMIYDLLWTNNARIAERYSFEQSFWNVPGIPMRHCRWLQQMVMFCYLREFPGMPTFTKSRWAFILWIEFLFRGPLIAWAWLHFLPAMNPSKWIFWYHNI
jgi:hypothetical protein